MLQLVKPHPQTAHPDDAPPPSATRLVERILRALPEPGDHATAVPGLSFYRRDGSCDPGAALYEPSFSLVLQGRKRVLLGGEPFEYGAGHFVLTSVDLPTIAQVLAGTGGYPFLSLMLRLDLGMVKDVIGEIDLNGGPEVDNPSAMAIGAATPELIDAVTRLADLADAQKDIPVLGQLAVREIVYRLLSGPSGALLRQTAILGTQCNRIAGVIAWLRDHYTEPTRIEDLADMAAMGVSTLHHHFKTITRMSPLQYQRHFRLHEARRLLLVERLDASTVAFRVGYESATQFSREYKRLFGNPPVRDVSLLRNG